MGGNQRWFKASTKEKPHLQAKYKQLRNCAINQIRDYSVQRNGERMLDKFGLLSVNQLVASIKLVEVWKSFYQKGYSIKLGPYNHNLPNQTHDLRPQPNRVLNDSCRLRKFESSFAIDADRIWNTAAKEITCAPSLNIAKNAVRLYCKSLPI